MLLYSQKQTSDNKTVSKLGIEHESHCKVDRVNNEAIDSNYNSFHI